MTHYPVKNMLVATMAAAVSYTAYSCRYKISELIKTITRLEGAADVTVV